LIAACDIFILPFATQIKHEAVTPVPNRPLKPKVTFCVRGVISPLLANIALGVIEGRYERWTHHRRKTQARRTCDGVTAALRARMGDRKAGRPVFFPVRYADDFVILVSGTREQAEQEKAELASHLHETMSLELSVDKTRVSDLTATNGTPGSASCRGSKSRTPSGRTFGTR
jgi:hypothetical protein